MSLLKEKFSGGSRGGQSASVEAEQPLSIENSPSATPEMVRRRVEAATQDNNENSGRRRTSTPEIVRIRTTEEAGATASAREDSPHASAQLESNKASSAVQADVIRHGMLVASSNSEIVVRKGCDQDEARHRPASGAEVVRYKVVEEQLSQFPPSASTKTSLEKKTLLTKTQTISTNSDKDKKQQSQMSLRHQVS